MSVLRYTMVWQGFSGAPGYTSLHFITAEGQPPGEAPPQADMDAIGPKVKTFFTAINNYLPGGVTISYPGTLDELDTATGELLDTHNVPVQTVTSGGGSGSYSAAVGACVSWHATGIVNGRRLRGRTFLVPLTVAAFATDGTLSDTARTAIQSAATALGDSTSGLDLCVWHRPTAAGNDGAAGTVVAATVKDKTAVLRSRRD